MDKASAPGAGDSRFESWAGHLRRPSSYPDTAQVPGRGIDRSSDLRPDTPPPFPRAVCRRAHGRTVRHDCLSVSPIGIRHRLAGRDTLFSPERPGSIPGGGMLLRGRRSALSEIGSPRRMGEPQEEATTPLIADLQYADAKPRRFD
jgi:hypothetical protein